MWAYDVLRCIDDGCKFALEFKCATLPQVVKHRVDDDPLTLCYGEKACGKLWCDICEKETNPNIWFYTCKDHRASLHTKCVIGDFLGIMPRSTEAYAVVLNNSICRPFCSLCKMHCIFQSSWRDMEEPQMNTIALMNAFWSKTSSEWGEDRTLKPKMKQDDFLLFLVQVHFHYKLIFSI